ncbi:MAG TPA: ABC transporter permease [Puia sp.]|jgi:predicted permease|nr:ABC transporter permease [Puia sp.]
MLRSYLAIFLRGFRKKPVYSILNITGLALGIACAALIFLWVEDELSFDHSYARRDQLYGVMMNMEYSNKIETNSSIPGPMADAVRAVIPDVVNISRFGFGQELFAINDKAAYENGLYVDTGFFSMMQPEFIKGNAAGFTNLHSIVISATMATKFFGSADPIGRTLRVDNTQEFMVIGVVKDAPSNVSLRYGWLAPVQNFLDKNRWLKSWDTYGISTLVQLRDDADAGKVSNQLTALLRPKSKIYTHASCLLQSIKDWRLRSRFTNGHQDGGAITYVHLMSAIAWIIIFIACINFMNLATARAGQRAREVGVRKTLGAVRKALIGQFIFESLLMSFLAVALAIILVYIALPGFNTLVGKQLPFVPFAPVHLAALLTIGILCGLIAGSYPAFYLSSFQPVAVLKGLRIKVNTGAGFIRKGLVITQFTVSVTLIVCTVIIYQQVQYARSRDLGFDKEHLISISLRGDLAQHFDAVRTELMQTGLVANASLSASPPLSMWETVTSQEITWAGADAGKGVRICWEHVSPEYFSTMGLQIKRGRNFYPDAKVDSNNMIINGAMAELMGKEGRVGGYLSDGIRAPYRIVGIVKNFLFNDMHASSVAPLMLSCGPVRPGMFNFMEVRLKAGNDLPTALTKVETILKANNPGYPVDYRWTDQDFEGSFSEEAHLGQFAGIFSMLAIFISCLGLFGLAAYTAERRTKEIGIRKILGASTTTLASLLSKEFLQLVTLSCLIAFPLAWWVMNGWLKDYSYRITIRWWVFALSGAAAVSIALLTVSFLAIRTARTNPVKSLRTD